MEIKAETKPCEICQKLGKTVPVERLPGNGILWRVTHKDSTCCEWSEYDSFENLRSPKDDKPSVDIDCPECGRIGKIGTEREDPVHRPDTYTYKMHHSDGKKCWVKSEHRDIVLKALGRYIDIEFWKRQRQAAKQKKRNNMMLTETPGHLKSDTKRLRKSTNEYNNNTKMICPVCEKEGTARRLNKPVRYYISHGKNADGCVSKHYMKTDQHKEAVASKLGLQMAEERILEENVDAQPQQIQTVTALEKATTKKNQKVTRIMCPKCGKEGTAGCNRNGNRFQYVIRHQRSAEDRQLRCYMTTVEQKEAVSKALGLYIPQISTTTEVTKREAQQHQQTLDGAATTITTLICTQNYETAGTTTKVGRPRKNKTTSESNSAEIDNKFLKTEINKRITEVVLRKTEELKDEIADILFYSKRGIGRRPKV